MVLSSQGEQIAYIFINKFEMDLSKINQLAITIKLSQIFGYQIFQSKVEGFLNDFNQ